MDAGFRDLLAWLLAWQSSPYLLCKTPGPYRVAAAITFAAGAVHGLVEHTGATTGMVSGSNELRG